MNKNNNYSFNNNPNNINQKSFNFYKNIIGGGNKSRTSQSLTNSDDNVPTKKDDEPEEQKDNETKEMKFNISSDLKPKINLDTLIVNSFYGLFGFKQV